MSKKHNNDDDDDFNDFGFLNLNEMIKKLFGNIRNLPNLGEDNPKIHQKSVTYRFGTGMDKPEIRVNGKRVDESEFSDFMKNIGPNTKIVPSKIRMHSGDLVSEIDLKEISAQGSVKSASPQFEKTYFEVDSSDGVSLITIELPGVEKDRIFISQSNNIVTVIGENDFTAYKAEFDIDYQYNKTEIEGHNSIWIIKLTK